MSEQELGVLLARLDERSKTIQSEVERIRVDLANRYVTNVEFEPIKRLVYGMAGLIMAGVAGGLLKLVIS
jgi:hypothetical protein